MKRRASTDTASSNRAEAFFGPRAAAYDDRYGRADSDGHALSARLSATVRLAGNGPGGALDVGCGAGRLCMELAGCGWTVSGLDASPEMVALARERLPEARDRIVEGRIEQLPFPDESFDLVTATGVLEYADMARALREIARVARPGSRAVISYPNPRAFYGIWKTHVWYPALRSARRVVGRGRPVLAGGAGALDEEAFCSQLRAAGLGPMSWVHTSYLVLPTPIELALPRTAARLGARVEGRSGRPARQLATQIVYEARKPR